MTMSQWLKSQPSISSIPRSRGLCSSYPNLYPSCTTAAAGSAASDAAAAEDEADATAELKPRREWRKRRWIGFHGRDEAKAEVSGGFCTEASESDGVVAGRGRRRAEKAARPRRRSRREAELTAMDWRNDTTRGIRDLYLECK